MNIFRRFSLFVVGSILTFSLFLFGLFFTLHVAVDSPKPVEDALSQSGIYKVAMKAILEEKEAKSALPLTDPHVQAAAEAALPASQIQSNTEKAIEHTYAWMHGDAATPNFKIDLSSNRTDFADNVAAYVQQKLSGLPACASGTMTPHSAQEILALNCIPRGVTAGQLADLAHNYALQSGVISNNEITADTLKDTDGQSVFSQLNKAPEQYHKYRLSLYILPVVIVLLSLIIIFGNLTRRAGLRRVGIIFLSTGLYSIVAALLVLWGLSRIDHHLAAQASSIATLQSSIIKAIDVLAHSLRNWWLGFSAGYILLGVVGLVLAHTAGKRRLQTVTSAEKSLGHNPNTPLAGTTFHAAENSNKDIEEGEQKNPSEENKTKS